MVEYIRQFALGLANRLDLMDTEGMGERSAVLVEELNRLDPRDFTPAEQLSFVETRLEIRRFANDKNWHRALASYNQGGYLSMYFRNTSDLCRKAATILGYYLGEGGHKVRRGFSFIADPDLRAIVERDYHELASILFPSGAWKSTVVSAGSILEAILHDLMNQANWQSKALESTEAPKKKLREWKLEELITVAADIGVLAQERADSIDQVLRDYRNFIHPTKELRAKHPCVEAEALMAKGALDGVCNHLDSLYAGSIGSSASVVSGS